MLRSTLRKLSRTLTSTTRRPARPLTRRAALQVEGLEDRMVLSTASLTGSTLNVIASPGPAIESPLTHSSGTAVQSNEFAIKKTSDQSPPVFFKNAQTQPSIRSTKTKIDVASPKLLM